MKKYLFILAICLASFVSQAQTGLKGNVTTVMNAGRVVDGKEIQVSDLPFTNGRGNPFTIMIVPKVSTNTTEVEVIKARYFQGDAGVIRDVPITVNNWNVVALDNIPTDAVNTTLFTNYRVFVGFGSTISPQ